MELLPNSLRARLKLAGKFDPSELREEVVRQPGWRKVEELGFLSRAGVGDLLGSVRAGLVLFHPAGNHDRSQPNKLFEYMSAGIPVIASDFPLWRQIIRRTECGLVVDPLNVKAIAGAVEYLLTNAEEAEEMGRRGREAIKREYNWETQRAKLLALYSRQ
jgi:glycosyltransferase involved in cell wall biosynthesis